jgi:YD repeat-containing protein
MTFSGILSPFKCIRRIAAIMATVAMMVFAAATPNHAYAGSATYKYDNLGRLTSITYGTGVVITYTYDAAGNRGLEVVTGTGQVDPQAQAAVMAIILQLLLGN